MTTKHCSLPSERGKSIVFLPIELGRFWMKFRGIEPRVVSLIGLSGAVVSVFLRVLRCFFVFVCVSLLSYSSCLALLLRANVDPKGVPKKLGRIVFHISGVVAQHFCSWAGLIYLR